MGPDPRRAVPGTQIRIQGTIDRLDLRRTKAGGARDGLQNRRLPARPENCHSRRSRIAALALRPRLPTVSARLPDISGRGFSISRTRRRCQLHDLDDALRRSANSSRAPASRWNRHSRRPGWMRMWPSERSAAGDASLPCLSAPQASCACAKRPGASRTFWDAP